MQVVHTAPLLYHREEEDFAQYFAGYLFDFGVTAEYLDHSESSWPLFSYSLKHSGGVTGLTLSFEGDGMGRISALQSIARALSSLQDESSPRLCGEAIQGGEPRCYVISSGREPLAFLAFSGDRLQGVPRQTREGRLKGALVASLNLKLDLVLGTQAVPYRHITSAISTSFGATNYKTVILMNDSLELSASSLPEDDQLSVSLILGRFSLPLETLLSLRNGSTLRLTGLFEGAGALVVGGEEVARASVRFEEDGVIVKIEEIY